VEIQSLKPDSLKKQLETTRFERALEVAESLAEHRALLTTTELSRLNQIVTGNHSDPWRQGTVTLTLPSGKEETLTILADPLQTARDKLHRATELAEEGDPVDAAVHIYVDLVLAHVFEDGNRRTAVCASHYFLSRYEVPVSGKVLHELGLGDLRETGHIDSLRELIHQMAKFAQKRRRPPF
jgi:Fic family protein